MKNQSLDPISGPTSKGRLTDLVAKASTRKLTLALVLSVFSMTSWAASITLQGSFAADDDVQLFSISVATPETVDIRSYGYAGGTTSTGTVVPAGGFDTILTLFSAAGAFIDDNDDGAGVAADPSTGQHGDARLTANLAAGNYIVALTQYDNFSIGDLADGFGETGHPNFTADPSFASGGPCAGNMFRDISGTAGRCRTGNWTIDFVNVTSATPTAPVPEPSTLLLAGFGLGLLLLGRVRRRTTATALAAAVVVALAAGSMQAQTTGPDYSNVQDFLNGNRTLLDITDLTVVAVGQDGPTELSMNFYGIPTSSSQQTSFIGMGRQGGLDSAGPLKVMSGRMWNTTGAVNLTVMRGGSGFTIFLKELPLWGVQICRVCRSPPRQ